MVIPNDHTEEGYPLAPPDKNLRKESLRKEKMFRSFATGAAMLLLSSFALVSLGSRMFSAPPPGVTGFSSPSKNRDGLFSRRLQSGKDAPSSPSNALPDDSRTETPTTSPTDSPTETPTTAPTDSPTDSPKLTVFITSDAFQPEDIQGLAGGDALCQGLADNSTSPQIAGKSFTAWLADATISSITERFVLDRDLPYFLPDGTTLVATDFNDLLDSTIENAISQDEKGDAVRSANGRVWTGVLADGKPDTKDNCGDWTNNTVGSGRFGLFGNTDIFWTNRGPNGCTKRYHLYCFEQQQG